MRQVTMDLDQLFEWTRRSIAEECKERSVLFELAKDEVYEVRLAVAENLNESDTEIIAILENDECEDVRHYARLLKADLTLEELEKISRNGCDLIRLRVAASPKASITFLVDMLAREKDSDVKEAIMDALKAKDK